MNSLRLDRKYSDAEFGKICRSLIKNLLDFHNSNHVHRDIKPDNILKLNEDNDYTFCDLNISKQFEKD